MGYFDIAMFEVDAGLSKRLGFKRIRSNGKDITVASRLSNLGTPQVVIGKDPSLLIGAVRDPDVEGIIFSGNELNKKIIEKAAESGKTVFIPINSLVLADRSHRQPRLQEIRKIVHAAHKLKASAKLVTLASSKAELLSVAQLLALAELITKGQGAQKLLAGSP